jgi:hypothetical protein
MCIELCQKKTLTNFFPYNMQLGNVIINALRSYPSAKFTFSSSISSFARHKVKLLFLACTAAIAPDQLVEDGYESQQQHRKGQQKPVMSLLKLELSVMVLVLMEYCFFHQLLEKVCNMHV